MAADWQQIRVAAVQSELVDVEDLLWGAGALSVTLTPRGGPDLLEPGPGETPVWEILTVTALFAAEADTGEIAESIRALGYICTVGVLEDRVWQREWLRYFRPLRFGERLWVCPTGFEVDAERAVVLKLDPGLAFGTGTHPTTALCLEWLDANLPPNARVIDYGCGSGVLGIAASLLGARDVLCIDNDPQALSATQANAVRNSVRVSCSLPDVEPAAADVLLANILAGPLMDLRETLVGALQPGGQLVLSGIKQNQGDALMAAYDGALEDLQLTEQDGWLRIAGRRRANAYG